MTNYLSPGDHPRTMRASDIVDERTDWLWSGRVPFRTLSRIDGDPGLGKSLVTVDLAARASTGMPMPGLEGPTNPPIDVLMLVGEDNAVTIRRRLDAADADLDRVLICDADIITFPKWKDWLEAEIRDSGATFVVIDPLMSFLDPGLSANQDQDVRRALRPLAGIAERTDAAVLLVGHLNKSGGTTAVYRSVGSIGLLASVRVAMIVGKCPNDENRRVIWVSGHPAASLRPRLWALGADRAKTTVADDLGAGDEDVGPGDVAVGGEGRGGGDGVGAQGRLRRGGSGQDNDTQGQGRPHGPAVRRRRTATTRW